MKKLFFILLILTFASVAYSQSYKIKKDSITSSSKKKRWDLTIRYPQIDKPATTGQRGLNKYVEDMMEAQEDSFKVWMKDWDVSPAELKDMSSYYEIDYSDIYHTDNVISVLFYEYSYFLGAAHPNNYNFSVNYDLENNKLLKLSDLFSGDYLKIISDISMREIVNRKREYDSTITGPDEWILEGAGPKEENYKVFTFNKEELTITFPTYQVASYAEGPQTVTIPLENLKGLYRKNGVLEKITR